MMLLRPIPAYDINKKEVSYCLDACLSILRFQIQLKKLSLRCPSGKSTTTPFIATFTKTSVVAIPPLTKLLSATCCFYGGSEPTKHYGGVPLIGRASSVNTSFRIFKGTIVVAMPPGKLDFHTSHSYVNSIKCCCCISFNQVTSTPKSFRGYSDPTKKGGGALLFGLGLDCVSFLIPLQTLSLQWLRYKLTSAHLIPTFSQTSVVVIRPRHK